MTVFLFSVDFEYEIFIRKCVFVARDTQPDSFCIAYNGAEKEMERNMPSFYGL